MGKIENEPTYDFVSDLKRCIDNIEIFDKEGFVIEIEEIKKAIDNIYNNYSNDNKKITKPQLLEHESQAGKTIYAFDDAKLRDFMLEKKILEQVDKMINQKLDDFKEELNKHTANQFINDEEENDKYNADPIKDIDFTSHVLKNNLKQIIEEKRIKQKDLAEKLGITTATMSNIINNRYGTTIELGFQIAMILGLRFTDVFYYEKEN